MRPHRLHPWAVLVAMVGGLIVGWWLVAPQAIGGSMAYLTVRGTSMVPTFGAGDLVVVRSDPPYAPGDVVAYRTPGDAGTVIVHRVVGAEGDRLVLQGDANDLEDALRPLPEEVLGRQVAVVPGLGGTLADLRPVILVGAVAGVGLLVWPAMRGRRRMRRDDPVGTPPEGEVIAEAGGAAPPPMPASDPLASLVERRPGPPWLWVVLAVIVGGAAVMVVRTPATGEQLEAVPWTVRTSFGWDAEPGDDPLATAVYGEDGLRTGETVFLAATPLLSLRLTSTLSLPGGGGSPDPADPSDPQSDPPPLPSGLPGHSVDVPPGGTLVAEAAVVSDAGWRRSVAALDPQPVTGGWAEAGFLVDLPAAWATAERVGAAAGRRGEVRLEVVASTIAADGAVRATALQAFALDEVSAQPLPPEAVVEPEDSGADGGIASGAAPPPGSEVAPVEPPEGSVAVDGVLETSEVVPASIQIGPLAVGHTPASLAVVLAAVVVALGGTASVVATARARRRGEASLLATRHRWSLVPLCTTPASLGGGPVDVASFDALRRVAGTVNQPIGVTSVGNETAFWVTDGVRAWRYRIVSA